MVEKIHGPYTSVDDMFKENHRKEAEFKKNYPTLWFLKEVYYWFYRLWHNKILVIPREIKWFVQRGRRGWADCDIWGFDSYLSKVIYTGLEGLKKIQHILPDWKEGMTEEEAKKSWDIKMEEMIWAFKARYNCTAGNWELWSSSRRKAFEREILKKYPETHFMTKEEDTRMKKGMRLLIDNFGALWD